MKNKITIYYGQRDQTKFFDLMHVINELNVEFEWNNEISTIVILWDWSQKDEVATLLFFLRRIFLDARIIIETTSEENQKLETLPENVEEVDVSSASCEYEHGSDNSKDAFQEPKDDKIIESSVIETRQDSRESDEEKTTTTNLEETSFEKEMVDEKSENCNLDEECLATENLPEKSEEIEEVTNEDESVQGICVPEEANLKQEECNDEKVESHEENITQVSETVEKVASEDESKVTLNTVLEETFGDAIAEFLNPSTGSYNERLFRLCDELKINGEAFKKAISMASSTKSIDKIYDDIARQMKKNVALVRIDVRKSFEKWMKTNYASIAEMYPKIEAKDFLNIFRNENQEY